MYKLQGLQCLGQLGTLGLTGCRKGRGKAAAWGSSSTQGSEQPHPLTGVSWSSGRMTEGPAAASAPHRANPHH